MLTSDEKPSSARGWKPGRVLLLIILLAPMGLVLLDTIIEWRARSFASRIAENLFIQPNTSNTNTRSSPDVSELQDESSPPPSPSPSPSCLSRWQQELLRSPMRSQAPPPARLTAALAEYEAMHSRCTHRQDLSRAIATRDPNDPCKYLVVLQDGKFGLGNHILSILSAFVYALLTNRTLLVDSRGHLPELFCEPFGNSSWLLPPDFPYNLLLQAPFIDSDLEVKLKHVNSVHLMLLSVQTEGQQQFFCSRTQELLARVPWLGWSSNQYFVPRLFMLPEFWRPLTELFPNVSEISTRLSRYLVLPKNRIWEKITRFHSSYLEAPGRSLGVQIRTRGERLSFDTPTYNRVKECLLQNHLLPETAPEDDKLKPKTNLPQAQNTTKVFITSLEGRFYEELKKKYMNQATVDGSLVQIHTMSHDQLESQSLEQAVNALAEIWLLSFSDELVTSSWSTFGYVAQALAGAPPYILNIKGTFEKSNLPACSRGQSPEPCNQFPFISVCKAVDQDSEHGEWIREHIRSCQDEPGGIQLVSS